MPCNVAHIRGVPEATQYLEDHLHGTAEVCERFLNELGISEVGRVIGLLHDLGKASQDFNDYIADRNDYSRGEIDHSTAGAQYINKNAEHGSIYQNIAIEMMELSILSHHSGLINCISSDGEPVFPNRINKQLTKTYYEEACGRIDPTIIDDINRSLDVATNNLAVFIEKLCVSIDDSKSRLFRLSLLNRFILSSLIDADRIDTISFQIDRKYERNNIRWDVLRDRFENRLCLMGKGDQISEIRKQISDDCLSAASNKPGVFTLSVPTGGGKTLSSFRFAINHLSDNNMSRIIYVVPYLSIIEQNAMVIRGMVNTDSESDYVTECHSNVDVGDDDHEESDEWNSPMDSWDGPIIFTSMVQFLETLFSSGTKRIRRMHNLANSVIVFDEIQCLPIKTVFMFNEAVNFLCKECGASVVLCTATQPCLGSGIDYPAEMSNSVEIVADVQTLFGKLKRTSVNYVNPTGPSKGPDFIADMALDKIAEVSSILMIVNTKRMAKAVFDLLREKASSDIDLYHLSTNMCAVHRKGVLERLKMKLGHGKVICVSTQLIEAGVDIDFDSVIRSLAGLDSIAQAAGRCNRNARHECGNVFVVRTGENTSSLRDIEEGCRYADILMRKYPEDVISPKVMNEYYKYYFFKRNNEMYYPLKTAGLSLFGMLSNNKSGVQSYKNKYGNIPSCLMRQAFRDANREFKVIDSVQSIVVPFDEESKNAISIICSERYEECKKAMRVLQNYSINTFHLNELIKQGLVSVVDYGSGVVYCLKEGFYDDDVGLVEKADHTTLML